MRGSFQQSKGFSSSSHMLVHYDPSLPVVLESDASQYSTGAVIHHCFPNGDERPIAYKLRSLNSSKPNYSQIEKEGLAIIFGVTKYYMYLFECKFTLRTDHKLLLKIFSPDSATTNAMRSIFARDGLSNQTVSNNGPPFQSAEYQEFLQQNGIQRILVSPYHPSSNGLAECFV